LHTDGGTGALRITKEKLVLIRHVGDVEWRSPSVTKYADEAAIQTLLAQSPDLIPGVGDRGLAIAREVALDAGYVDLIGVSRDGLITLVECKLKANPEIRRHVIDQILAYAATLWELSYESFDLAFSARTGTSLAHSLKEISDDDWDEEVFRAAVTKHLSIGRFRLVLAVDEITDELRRIVRFLNSHTSPELEVLALELRYVSDSGVEIVLPAVYGEESASSKANALTGTRWNEDLYFGALTKILTPSEVATARHLYEYAQRRGATFNWGVGPMPSVTARLYVAGKPSSVFSMYEWPKGTVKFTINFEYLVWNAPESALVQLANDVRRIPGVAERLVGLEAKEFKQRPGIPLDVFKSDEAIQQLEQAVDSLLRLPSQPNP
jgi:hypothetical protein